MRRFALDKDGRLHLEDREWLGGYGADSQEETCTLSVPEGYDPLQQAFDGVALATKKLQHARHWCKQVILARFMELMRATHVKAAEHHCEWASRPLYYTEHEHDLIAGSQNAVPGGSAAIAQAQQACCE